MFTQTVYIHSQWEIFGVWNVNAYRIRHTEPHRLHGRTFSISLALWTQAARMCLCLYWYLLWYAPGRVELMGKKHRFKVPTVSRRFLIEHCACAFDYSVAVSLMYRDRFQSFTVVVANDELEIKCFWNWAKKNCQCWLSGIKLTYLKNKFDNSIKIAKCNI